MKNVSIFALVAILSLISFSLNASECSIPGVDYYKLDRHGNGHVKTYCPAPMDVANSHCTGNYCPDNDDYIQ